jgi:2-amino-4-hydroxy-6-hydroxymethyldihydropteridine diphosphokinase
MRPVVFLGLGANLGDREAAIDDALARLEARGVAVRERSSTWLTEPVGGPPQGWFLNAAAGVETALSPGALLAACLDVELAMGRVRTVRNGPRAIDVDVLLYGQQCVERPGLTIPHPRLAERRFVLAPLAEIAPLHLHPVLGLTVAELLERCPDRSSVRRYAGAGTPA